MNTKTETKTYKILSIDAWASTCGTCLNCDPKNPDADPIPCWEWNSWHQVGEITLTDAELDNPIPSMIEAGFLNAKALELGIVDDDGHNVVIKNKETHEPLYAIEYGNQF